MRTLVLVWEIKEIQMGKIRQFRGEKLAIFFCIQKKKIKTRSLKEASRKEVGFRKTKDSFPDRASHTNPASFNIIIVY